jgi:(2Fe-2S) ferredoxin
MNELKFKKHLFICTNEREDKSRSSCGEARGMELVKLFKKKINELKLNTAIRAQRAGCIDACDFGPSIVVYGGVTPADVEEIVESHLLNNIPVERLRINFGAKT